MSEGFRGVATGAAAFEHGSLPGVPKEVQASFLLWLTAVGAGVVEMIGRFIYSLSVESSTGSGVIFSVVIKVIVYTAAVYIIAQMRLGKRWARITLAVLLGVIGTFSLVSDPISWLAGGNSLDDVFTEADLLFIFVSPVRVVHLAAVIAALVFMFLPAANKYFRCTSSLAGAP